MKSAGSPRVLVAEQAGMDELHVLQAQPRELAIEAREHRLGDVDGDHARAEGRGGDGELTGARAEVQDERIRAQAVLPQQRDLLGGARVLLGVVAGDVVGVEVLAPGAGELIDHPAGRASRCVAVELHPR